MIGITNYSKHDYLRDTLVSIYKEYISCKKYFQPATIGIEQSSAGANGY